jgi:hypothetical protein
MVEKGIEIHNFSFLCFLQTKKYIKIMMFFNTLFQILKNYPVVRICLKKGVTNTDISKTAGLHVGFLAPNVEAVQQWYTKCLELGGTDNGVPGP